jgi:IMP dehydrogenase
MRNTYSFDDVLLVPKYSDIESRCDVDLSSELDDKITLQLPIISSPMDTVTESAMAIAMAELGGLGVLHRYSTIGDQCHLVDLAEKEGRPLGAAIGVSGDYLNRAGVLVDRGVSVICIDVAHGHHKLVERAIKEVKDRHAENVHVMAGNVATLEAFNDLSSWGADSVRVGVGGGSICSTRLVTGHGIPTLQSVMDVSRTEHDTRIIADGGFKKSGDIVKALAAGADFVMLGSMLAGTTETPGELLSNERAEKYKVYRGMASADAQRDWRGKSSTPEGVSAIIPYKGSVDDIMRDIIGGIRSGLSYTGARNIRELQTRSEFVSQSPAGQNESNTHILWRYK